jgi:hypothetical protein
MLRPALLALGMALVSLGFPRDAGGASAGFEFGIGHDNSVFIIDPAPTPDTPFVFFLNISDDPQANPIHYVDITLTTPGFVFDRIKQLDLGGRSFIGGGADDFDGGWSSAILSIAYPTIPLPDSSSFLLELDPVTAGIADYRQIFGGAKVDVGVR